MRQIILFLITIVCFLCSELTYAQDFNGFWKGSFDYKTVGKDQVFTLEMFFHTDYGKIKGYGTAYPTKRNSTGIKNTKWKIDGTYQNGRIEYLVTEIMQHEGASNVCQSRCVYHLVSNGQNDILTGRCKPTGQGFDKETLELVDGKNCKEISVALNRSNDVSSEYITPQDIFELTGVMPVIETPKTTNSTTKSTNNTNNTAVQAAAAGGNTNNSTTSTADSNSEIAKNTPQQTMQEGGKTTTGQATINNEEQTNIDTKNIENQSSGQAIATKPPSANTNSATSSRKNRNTSSVTKRQKNRIRRINSLNKRVNKNFNDCPF